LNLLKLAQPTCPPLRLSSARWRKDGANQNDWMRDFKLNRREMQVLFAWFITILLCLMAIQPAHKPKPRDWPGGRGDRPSPKSRESRSQQPRGAQQSRECAGPGGPVERGNHGVPGRSQDQPGLRRRPHEPRQRSSQAGPGRARPSTSTGRHWRSSLTMSSRTLTSGTRWCRRGGCGRPSHSSRSAWISNRRTWMLTVVRRRVAGRWSRSEAGRSCRWARRA
jgi:hypothetical protein